MKGVKVMVENNEKGFELYSAYLSAYAFTLKCEQRRDETNGRLEGFISGLWFADLIDVEEYQMLRDYNRSIVKSIIRHYKKIGEWRQ